MTHLSLALLLFIPALVAISVNNHLQRRDITTIYQPTTVYETVFAGNIESAFRKTRKVYKHRHEVIKQNRQKYNGNNSDYEAYDIDNDGGHYKEGDEWCCEKEEVCDENEYEECNEGEEGYEEYFKEQDLIIRELDFDIYVIEIDEYVGTTITNEGYTVYNLLDGTTVTNGEFSLLEP